jgi:hypothetical protein
MIGVFITDQHEIKWRWTFAPGLILITIALVIRAWERRKRKRRQDEAFPVVHANGSKPAG